MPKDEEETGRMLRAWPEIQRAIAEHRCELVLSGISDAAQRQPSADDEDLQKLFANEDSPLNLLEISSMGLTKLTDSLCLLKQLTNLVLHSNRLEKLPEKLGDLTKLKLLDCSKNCLVRIPASISALSQLSTLNLASNKLTDGALPDFAPMTGLQTLDLSHNELETMPSSLFACAGSKLQNLALGANRIAAVAPEIDAMADLLKLLDLGENQLVELPVELRAMQKLKTLNLIGNRFTDKRFGKLVADKRHTAAAILDYLKKHGPPPSSATKGSKNDGSKKKEPDEEQDDKIDQGPLVTVHLGREWYQMRRMNAVVPIRPHIVCCVLHNIDLDATNLKKFLTVQNKLHDTLCDQRTRASIGTHDAGKFQWPITYTAMKPEELNITPMQRNAPMDGKTLIAALTAEAEALRKRQKRNTYSSVHKYLHLVKNLQLYPCLVDANGLVLSFAPVTNSETTKITPETRTMFIEVSSNESQALCRQVMDNLLEQMLSLDRLVLSIDQIKIMQENGELCVVYPDRHDLKSVEAKANVRREIHKEQKAE